MYTETANSLAQRFGGTVAAKQECEPFLQPGHEFLFGISLKDPKANFKLLDEYNLMNLAPDTRRKCLETQTSPFDNLLLIVYKNEQGETNFKLLNGMASVLVGEMIRFCER